jgi:DNA-3-methyladenine glycosylase
MKRLRQKFFRQKTERVAKDLLGKFLVRKIGKKKISGLIVETEAYVGPHDLASHASRGRTQRTSTMFRDAGHWYVYMVYGFYHCLNIVTENEDYPAAVLIRAIEPLEGIERMKKNRHTNDIKNLASGPGKLCRALEIDKKLNSTSALLVNSKLYIEDRDVKIPPEEIKKTARVGVDYAGHWARKPLRFYVAGNEFVSKR